MGYSSLQNLNFNTGVHISNHFENISSQITHYSKIRISVTLLKLKEKQRSPESNVQLEADLNALLVDQDSE